MGQSTDAILCYGIALDEDYDLQAKFPDLVEEQKEYWGDTSIRISGYDVSEYLKKEFGCVLIGHCSCDYRMYILSVEESETRAWRGDPQVITSLDIKPEWVEKLKKTAEFMGLSEAPQWWLASDWC